jgi:hypothetical protein
MMNELQIEDIAYDEFYCSVLIHIQKTRKYYTDYIYSTVYYLDL